MEVENVNEVAFLCLVCLTLLNGVRDVSSSSTARSEMVGWMAGSKLDEMASLEHLRKPKKARINMASSVRAVWTEW